MTSTAPAAPTIARSAAMERRLRQRRADARIRVKILSDCQLLAVHHASGLPGVAVSDPLSEMASLRRLLASLSQQLVELREEVKALRAGPTATAPTAASATATGPTATAPSASAAATGPTAAPSEFGFDAAEAIGWNDDLAGLFLPEYLIGARLLLPLLDETGAALRDFYTLDNNALLATGRALFLGGSHGICFRLSPDLDDRHPEDRVLEYGCCLHGQLTNGWLHITLWRPRSQPGSEGDLQPAADAFWRWSPLAARP